MLLLLLILLMMLMLLLMVMMVMMLMLIGRGSLGFVLHWSVQQHRPTDNNAEIFFLYTFTIWWLWSNNIMMMVVMMMMVVLMISDNLRIASRKSQL